ncbi:MAG: aspartate-semialdehyde dehydrogenase [Bacteroidales bacterium]|nr:aspartate-semialdehyde dehydrogenase [Bacteroidales bacterium]
MKIAIIGASGLVGQKMLQLLQARNFNADEILLAASERSIGKQVSYKGKQLKICSISEVLEKSPEIAMFSAGGAVSKTWAPKFAGRGCTVIDNSSAWRMQAEIPLIVPEVNASVLKKSDKIIANPNCSTIQLVHVLWPLHCKYELERVVVSTYQSVTGSGMNGIAQLDAERKGETSRLAYPHQIDLNCLPHGGDFLENGYTSEEMKLVNESRKILRIPALRLTSTVVRVPVKGGHSEAVNIEFKHIPIVDEVRNILSETPGIIVQDDVSQNLYPMPIQAEERDETFVGRIRADESEPNAINLWIVADNLRKGAATNAVQIAEYLLENDLV